MKHKKQFAALGLAMLVCTAFGGMCSMPAPPAEAVLAGLWNLSAPEAAGLDGKMFLFDENGRLAEIRTVIDRTTIVERDVHRETIVNGLNVTIRAAGGLIFDGMLSDDRTMMTGQLRTEFNVPFTNNTIFTDEGPGTFTKQ
jgi:hypothetical protein